MGYTVKEPDDFCVLSTEAVSPGRIRLSVEWDFDQPHVAARLTGERAIRATVRWAAEVVANYCRQQGHHALADTLAQISVHLLTIDQPQAQPVPRDLN